MSMENKIGHYFVAYSEKGLNNKITWQLLLYLADFSTFQTHVTWKNQNKNIAYYIISLKLIYVKLLIIKLQYNWIKCHD